LLKGYYLSLFKQLQWQRITI